MPVPGFNRPGDGAGGLKIPDKLNFVANLNAKNQPSTMADPVATLINKVGLISSIKSIQKISTTISAISQTVNIASVNPANTIVYLEFYNYIPSLGNTVNVELTNSTTITLTAYSAPSSSYVVGITVIEFNNVKSKQTGSVTTSSWSSPNIITISPVIPSKCLAFASFSCSSGGNNTAVVGYATVTNNTTLNIASMYGTGSTGTMKWQVLEFL